MSTRSVMIIGEDAPGGLRNSIIGGFRELGWSVEPVPLGPWRPALLAAAAFRLPRLASRFRHELRQAVEEHSASRHWEMVLVVKGPFVDGRTVDHLRRVTSAPVVCWNPDSPFDAAVSNRGAGIPAAINTYDAYVTWADDVADRLRRGGARNVIVVPFAWDPNVHQPVEGEGRAAGRIVFVGSGTKDRVAVLARLSRFRPIVYGNQWPEMPGVEVRAPVYGAEMSAVVGEAAWNLNILRPQNATSHNMRTFEVPGAGGNHVTALTDDHREYLGHDPRTCLYATHDELESILAMDPASLPTRPEDVLMGHTYAARVHTLLERLET